MLFIVPLKSPRKSASWEATSLLCRNTINSILYQTDKRFRIALVCNKKPLNCPCDSRLEVIEKDFPIPTCENEIHKDIKLKIKAGMVHMKSESPCYIMRVDADDFVSNKIVEHVKSNPVCDGWYMKYGYIWSSGRGYVIKKNHFNAYCGTSNIIWCNQSDFPNSMNDEDYLEAIWQHQGINLKLRAYGKKLNPFPFPGSVYHVDTSQNWYVKSSMGSLSLSDLSSVRKLAWKISGFRPLTSSFVDEFRLSSINYA